jgi:molybdate transport system substrate-binding protein
VADGETEVRRPRLVQAQPGTPVGSLVASGEVDIGFQQFSELKDIEGIEVLCPLPSPVGLATVFSAAITSGCTTPEAAKAFLAYIASPESASTKRIHGMEPA